MRRLKSMPILIVALVGACLCTHAATAQTTSVAKIAIVKAKIDYNKKGREPADSFVASLANNLDKVIRLDLELIPTQDKDSLGYSAHNLSTKNKDESNIVCGPNGYGIIESYSDVLELSFNHPEDFHSPVHITIGERKDFPFNELRCGAEETGSKEFSHVHVKGYFVVSSADIPTAVYYRLYPVAP